MENSIDVQSVTVHIPDALYRRLQRRARQSKRTLEAELLEALATGISPEEDLPADLAEALVPLSLLDDDALWRAARSHLPVSAAHRMEALHLKLQSEGLTEAEKDELSALLEQYERFMLVRAHSA